MLEYTLWIPLVMTNTSRWKMAHKKFVDLPSQKFGDFPVHYVKLREGRVVHGVNTHRTGGPDIVLTSYWKATPDWVPQARASRSASFLRRSSPGKPNRWRWNLLGWSAEVVLPSETPSRVWEANVGMKVPWDRGTWKNSMDIFFIDMLVWMFPENVSSWSLPIVDTLGQTNQLV